MFAPSKPKSSVQIEVISSEDYEEEMQTQSQQQRATQRQQQHDESTARQRREGASITEEEKGDGAASSASAVAPVAAPAASSSASSSRWTPLLTSLSLPPFFATLHDTQTYDATAWKKTMQITVPKFHREAVQSLKALEKLLRDPATPMPPRSIATQILLSAARFLIPLPPSTPHMLSGDSDEDPTLTVKEQPAAQIDFPWQKDQECVHAAVQVIGALAQRTETATSASETSSPSSSSSSTLSNPLSTLSSSHVQSLLSNALPATLAHLRASMRSSAGTVPGTADASINPSWKTGASFPDCYLVGFLVNFVPVSSLAGHISDVIALVLPLVEDHEMRFKIPGLATLSRILQIIPGSAYPSGLGQVLLTALKTCLSFRERSIVALAVPAWVLGYMVFFPVVMGEDEAMLERLAQAEGLKEATHTAAGAPQPRTPTSTASFSSTKSNLTVAAASLDLHHRVSAASALLKTLLGEMTFFALSPSVDNTFALFVYVQAMLPALLYAGPLGILPHLQQLLSLLLHLCTLTSSFHSQTVCGAWLCVEFLLGVRVVGERVAKHRGRIIEVACEAWIQRPEQNPSSRHTSTGRSSSIVGTGASPSAAATIVSMLARLRAFDRPSFHAIWNEVAGISEWTSLHEEIKRAAIVEQLHEQSA